MNIQEQAIRLLQSRIARTSKVIHRATLAKVALQIQAQLFGPSDERKQAMKIVEDLIAQGAKAQYIDRKVFKALCAARANGTNLI